MYIHSNYTGDTEFYKEGPDPLYTDINKLIFDDKFIHLYTIQKRFNWEMQELIVDKNNKANLVNFIKNGLEQIYESMNDVDKVFSAIRYVADYFKYDGTVAYENVIYSINTRRAVCQQYGWAIAMLLRAANIQALPIVNKDHKLTAVKIKTKNDNKPKWYFLDATWFDTDSKLKMQVKHIPHGWNTIGIRDYWQILIKPSRLEKDTLQYVGSRFNLFLPWDQIQDKDYAAQEDFFETSVFNNPKFEDNDITLQGVDYISRPSRYFFYKGYWYFISHFKRNNNISKMGLFKFQLDNKIIKLVKDETNNKQDNNDEIAKLINFKESSIAPMVFQEGNLIYFYYYLKNKHILEVFDIEKKIKIKEIELNNKFPNVKLETNTPIYGFTVENGNINFEYKNNNNEKNETSFKILDLLENSNLSDNINNFDLFKKIQLARIEYGTYMFLDNYNNNEYNYLPIKLRIEFDKLRKEIEIVLKEELSSHQINNFINKLDISLKKLREFNKQ
ncbi:transglutaminase domain-containing protein [Metamycoplasma buccale]|uniref:transglutaminase domain-containing protein n=1 Tax=Metamycoplasma buccale TaxID=55602 RepID=UPI00398E6C00